MVMVAEPREQTLEQRVYDKADHLKIGDGIKIRFPEMEGKIILSLVLSEDANYFLGRWEGNYLIGLKMPWKSRYYLGRYKSEKQARNAFGYYDSALEMGGTIILKTTPPIAMFFENP